MLCQLYSVLEETRHSLRDQEEDLDDEDHHHGGARERAAVAGDTVRRLLRRYDRAARTDDAAAASTGSQVDPASQIRLNHGRLECRSVGACCRGLLIG